MADFPEDEEARRNSAEELKSSVLAVPPAPPQPAAGLAALTAQGRERPFEEFAFQDRPPLPQNFHQMSFEIPPHLLPAVFNQHSAGICWAVAMRGHVYAALKRAQWTDSASQLSLAFVIKHRKLEQGYTQMARYAAEAILSNGHLGPALFHIGDMAIGDGGRSDIFVAITEKYGAVPEFAMPATPSLTGSKMLNRQLSAEVRRGQRQLRRLAERGHTDVGPYREVIGQTMTVLRSLLDASLGRTPTNFNCGGSNYSPRSFFAEVEAVCHLARKTLVTDRDCDREHKGRETVSLKPPLQGARAWRAAKLPMRDIERAIISAIRSNEAVPVELNFSSGVDLSAGTAAIQVPRRELPGLTFDMTKEDLVDSGDLRKDHGVLIVGVHVGRTNLPLRYKIQNSYGTAGRGNGGYVTATADWLRANLFTALLGTTAVGGKVAVRTSSARWVPELNEDNPIAFTEGFRGAAGSDGDGEDEDEDEAV